MPNSKRITLESCDGEILSLSSKINNIEYNVDWAQKDILELRNSVGDCDQIGLINSLEEKFGELSDEVSDLKSHFECEIENLKNEMEHRIEQLKCN